MAELISFNGVPYTIPDVGDQDWGNNVTNFLVAIPQGCLQKIGGAFTLTSDVNFGASFGLISSYFKSRSANIASAGIVRLANTDLLEWRNFANSGNNILGVNASDQLTYNGSPLEFNVLTDSHIFVGNASNIATDVAVTGDIGVTNTGVTAIQAGVIVNADVSASAAIAYSKLSLTGQIVNNDIGSSASIVYSKLALTNSIVNNDIATGAAIDVSKLAALSPSSPVKTDGSGFLTASLINLASGSDITGVLAISHGGTGIASGGISGHLMQSSSNTIVESPVTVDGSANIGGVLSITSAASNPASAGFLGLASTDQIEWRNNANSGNLSLAKDTSDNLTWASGIIANSTGHLNLSNVVNTLAVTNGGTGDASLTAYAVICGGTTSTGAVQSVAALGSSGQVLTSNGAGALPTFQSVSGSGTVNSGTAGRLSLYATSTTAVSDTYVQNTKNITVAIVAQASRSANLVYNFPNPGDAVTSTNICNDKNDFGVNGQWIFGSLLGTNFAVSANQLSFGNVNTPFISVTQPASGGQVYTVPDPGASCNFILSKGTPTMQVSLAMGSNKITGLATPTTSGDALSYGNVLNGTTLTLSSTTNSNISFDNTATHGIVGTATNNSATAGNVGEYVSSSISTFTNVTTTNQYADLTSISLTAGDWDVSGQVYYFNNGATWTAIVSGISVTSGNSATGLVNGESLLSSSWASSLVTPIENVHTLANLRFSLSGTTTVYLKYRSIYSVGTPQAVGSIRARRVR